MFEGLQKVADAAADQLKEAQKDVQDHLTDLSDEGKRLVTDMRILAGQETKKDAVRQNAGKPEYAAMAIQATYDTSDPTLICDYLRSLPSDARATLDSTTQGKLYDVVSLYQDASLTGASNRFGAQNFDESRASFAALHDLPAAQVKAWNEWTDTVNRIDRGEYVKNIPACVAVLPLRGDYSQEQVYARYPLLFIKAFPDSPLGTGDPLKRMVKEDLKNFERALTVKDSLVVRHPGLLENPNLTSDQVNDIGNALVKMQWQGEGKSPNEGIFANISGVYKALLSHPQLSSNTRTQLTARFSDDFGVPPTEKKQS